MFMNKRYIVRAVALQLAIITVFSSCKTWNNTQKGAVIGAGTGAAVGGAIGAATNHSAKNTIIGAIIGTAVGGATGAAIGRYMDKQAAEIQRDVKGAKVERVGEGIRITFDSGILFDVGSYTLRNEAKSNISELAKVLQKYGDTNILIEGHTDNTGGTDMNQKLSENRANAVGNYAKSLGVLGTRMSIQGYGENQPIGDNKTDAGRQANRRVEVAIMANKKLQKAAERGEI
jgi:outer membrane protein OmpA-like peptidoglycan-associated protein